MQVVYQGIRQKKRLRGPVIDLVALVASLGAHYYTLTAFSCTLMCAAEKLVYRTQNRSRRDMIGVFQQQQQKVWLLRAGMEVEGLLADLQIGDTIVVHAGGLIPVDGVITQGTVTIDQHMLTGEAQPVEKGVGDNVLAATLLLTGRIQVRVEKAGNATITAQIGAVMSEIEDYRERQEMRCDETADRLVLPTLTAGALTLMRLGPMSAVTVVGANFTETLRIAYPLGALTYLNLAAQRGILIKDGRALEMLSQVDTVIFDKTGTLTLEQPAVIALHPCSDISEAQLLTYAAAAEFRQTHPIARAILEAAEQRHLLLPPIEEAAYEVGYGIKVQITSGEHSPFIRVGSARFMIQEGLPLPALIEAVQQRCHKQGHSLVYVALDQQLVGVVELAAKIRPEVQALVQQLQQRGLKRYILSGDQQPPTQHLAESLGLDGYFAEVLPADKARYVEALQKQGRKVCFIGDGINDAIALKQADVSISLRGATTVATDIAQIIFMDQSLVQLDHLFDLARQLDANLKRSFAAMIIPGVVNLGGALFFRFGIRSAIVLFNVSLLAGVANSLSPLLKLKQKSRVTSQKTSASSGEPSGVRAVRFPISLTSNGWK
ncbi:MAG: heavy metal translocating P-type ATPase [Caldilineaceae bacterium]